MHRKGYYLRLKPGERLFDFTEDDDDDSYIAATYKIRKIINCRLSKIGIKGVMPGSLSIQFIVTYPIESPRSYWMDIVDSFDISIVKCALVDPKGNCCTLDETVADDIQQLRFSYCIVSFDKKTRKIL